MTINDKDCQGTRQGGEAVEVVACIDLDTDAGVVLYANREPHLDAELLMTVAQHQRILAATVGSAEPVAWREHSVNYAKVEKCPETIETLQAAWDRDQELINDMRHEIARHKTRINRLEQRRPADQVADDLTMVKVPRELLEELRDLASDAVEHHRQAFAGYKLERQANMDKTIKAGRALLEVKS